jgi:aspartyl-tRNA(Asn)/glutamyl-tRNA(Gln) amidotransferase subunit A
VTDYEAALDGDIRRLRVGVPVKGYFVDDLDADVGRAFEASVAALKGAGAEIVPVETPHMDAVSTYGAIISRVEAATIHAEWMRKRPRDFGPALAARLYPGYGIPAVYYVEALSRRGPILKAFARTVFGAADVFVAPALRIRTPTLAETDIDAGVPGSIEAFNSISANTRAINYLGLPSVCVPCGFDDKGLPVGLMIQGRPFAEARILKVADAYQRVTDWHARKPPVAA